MTGDIILGKYPLNLLVQRHLIVSGVLLEKKGLCCIELQPILYAIFIGKCSKVIV